MMWCMVFLKTAKLIMRLKLILGFSGLIKPRHVSGAKHLTNNNGFIPADNKFSNEEIKTKPVWEIYNKTGYPVKDMNSRNAHNKDDIIGQAQAMINLCALTTTQQIKHRTACCFYSERENTGGEYLLV